MISLSYLYDLLFTTTNPFNAQNNTASLDLLRTRLNTSDPKTLRVYVAGATGKGHQSSSINVIWRLARAPGADNLNFGFGGMIEALYEGGDEVRDRLRRAFGLVGTDEGDIPNTNASIKLTSFDIKKPPSTTVDFGFTGGADEPDRNVEYYNYAKGLNVRAFLRLQPFGWVGFREEIQFLDPADRNILLTNVTAIGGSQFSYRVFYQDPQEFDNIPAPADPRQEIVEWITKDAQLKRLRLAPVYGIRKPPCEMNRPSEAVALLGGSMLAWQREGNVSNPNRQPVVIINFDNLPQSMLDDGTNLIAGGLTATETGLAKQASWVNSPTYTLAEARRRYFQNQLNGQNRFQTLFDPTFADFKNTVNALTDTDVLFVQLGGTSQQYFNYSMYRANMPPAFEGNNTANTVVNMGKPYLNTRRKNPGGGGGAFGPPRYPSTTLAYYNPYSSPNAMAAGADQLNQNLMNWPVDAKTRNPCQILGVDLLRPVTSENNDGGFQVYFRNLRNFFAQPEQDKLSVGSAYLQTQLASHGLGGLEAMDAKEDENPLDPLYEKLKAKVVIGQDLDLIPGVLTTGKIPDYFEKLIDGLAPSLKFKVTKFEPENGTPPIKEIILEGATDLFESAGVKTTDIKIVFTQQDNKLVQTTTFTFKQTWTMPEVPWIVFKDIFVTIQVQDSLVPAWVKLGGTYPPLDGMLSTQLPSEKDQWLLTADFEDYLSIDKAFQMAAGVNLVATLPPPLNTLSDLGLANVEAAYGLKEENLDSLSFVMKSRSNDPLPLVGKIALGDIEVNTLIIDPIKDQKAKVKAAGVFTIGSGEDAGQVKVSVAYPDFNFVGKLEKGVIKFEDMMTLFLPPEVTLDLPALPEIDQFEFSYTKKTDTMSVSMNLNIEWTFGFDFVGVPNSDLFTLNSVGFSVSREKKINTGSVTAQTTLFPSSSAKVNVEISALYDGKSNWTFKALTKNNVDAEVIISDYLGPDWVPTAINLPVMKDVGVTLLWGKDTGATSKAQSFEFTAKTAQPWAPIEALKDIFTLTFDLTLGYGPQKSEGIIKAALPAPTRLVALPTPANVNGPMETPVVGPYGKLIAGVNLWNIHLLATYEFQQDGKQKFCVTWLDVGLTACLENKLIPAKGNDPATEEWIATFSLDGESIGSLVEKFVSWATGTAFGLQAPWTILNDIDLSGVKIIYNFTKETVGFKIDIGPINLGLFTIKAISLDYNPNGNPAKTANGDIDVNAPRSKNKVEINIEGSFVWLEGDKLGWEPDDPSTTPAAPGSGNKFIDLRMLALGQHVTVDGLTRARNVNEVLETLRDLNIPQPPDIPIGGPNQPVFDAKSSWFVGFDFGLLKAEEKEDGGGKSTAVGAANDTLPMVGNEAKPPVYFIQLGIVFNDPNLYALRIALDGPMAKVFAGLEFQIMYQQYSKNVGRYSVEIALPMVMRKFQIGAASITLPSFAIDIFTNGDFQVDIGFPWKEDFTRSFSIEFMAGPIPVIGSAGFYFGKLSSGSTDKVPVTSKGWFNPVIVFGFGGQIGLGKSIEAGILSAGFSLTAFGIIEGVIARWQPYKGPTPIGDNTSLQDGYYFSMTGTIGVQGRLFGSINFAIISAELNVAIKLYVRITFASYEPIPITALASVDVSLKVKINLGLFKVTISLSFKAEVEATFVLENPMGGTAPWADNSLMASAANGNPSIPSQKRLAARGLNKQMPISRGGLMAMSATDDTFDPEWDSLQVGTVLNLQGYLMPALTVASGDNDHDPSAQPICYALNFFLEGEKPIEASDPNALSAHAADESVLPHADVAHAARARARKLQAMDAGSDKFEALAERILKWVIAAGKQQQLTPAQVDDVVVSDLFLSNALNYLADNTFPIPVANIDQFLEQQTKMSFGIDQSSEEDVPAVFFPAPPEVKLTVPENAAIPGSTKFEYTFGDYNNSTEGYIGKLNEYFAELKVQVEETTNNDGYEATSAAATGPSIASYIFGDYFGMIGRLTIQALRDGLRNYKLDIKDHSGQSIQAIVDSINAKADFSPADYYTVGEVFAANPTHKLNSTEPLLLKIQGAQWQSAGGKSFNGIATDLNYGASVTGHSIALLNGQNPHIIAPGIPIEYDTESYLTQSADTLESIAMAFGFVHEVDGIDEGDVATLLEKVPAILAMPNLLAAQSILQLPEFSHAVTAEDNLQLVAQSYGIDLDALASANGGAVNLFSDTENPNLNVPHLAKYRTGDLIDEMRRTLGMQHVSAMVSRFYLHGLRLPTEFKEGDQRLVPNHKGLFAEPGGRYPPNLGLFALTGQVFPLPDIPDPTTVDPTAFYRFQLDVEKGSWLTLGGGSTAEFILNAEHENTNYKQFAAVRQIAHGGYFDLGSSAVAPLPLAGAEPSRYPLSTEIPWQAAVDINLPREATAPVTPRPRMWSLPNELINTPHDEGVLPVVKPAVARTIESRGTTRDEPLGNYGFGTMVTFKIKRLISTDGNALSKRTYEVIGAPEAEITLLERLLDQLRDNSSSFNQVNLMYRPASTSSEVAGWLSDDPSQSLMGLTQTNLSTETRPATALSAQDAPQDLSNIIGSPNAFMRLLWQASITRQGGYYLNYSTDISGDTKGLPDHIFNEHGEAEVAILAVFDPKTEQGQMLGNYMNVAITNEAFDLTDAALVAVSVPIDVPQGREFVPGQDTLASYAASYYMGVGLLVELNADRALREGAVIRVEGGTYQVPAVSDPSGPGGDLNAIAAHFFTTVQDIRDINAAGNALPDTLSPLTAIKLPSVDVTISASTPGSFAGMSQYFSSPLAELASANAERNKEDGTYPQEALIARTGPVSLAPEIKQGVAGVSLTRPVPVVPESVLGDADNWAIQYLRQTFSLLGYRIAANAENQYFPESNWGLPAGPIDPDATPADDKVRAPLTPTTDGDWTFELSAPYSSVLAAGHVDPSPYLGVGDILQFELSWLDIYGNRILSQILDPQPLAGAPQNKEPQITGYADRLLGIGQWAAVTSAYRIYRDDASDTTKLELQANFDNETYLNAAAAIQSGHPEAAAAGKRIIDQAKAVYQTVSAQLNDPSGIEIDLSTTLIPGESWNVLEASGADQMDLRAWVASIVTFLDGLPGKTDTVPLPYQYATSIDPTKVNSDQIFKLSVVLKISRHADLVAGDLRTAKGVAETLTPIAPSTGNLDDQKVDEQRGLEKLAADFATAFASETEPTYRLATGTDRNVFTGTGNSPVWVVQIGDAEDGTGISYDVLDVGDPAVFAPRPIYNKLKSKQKTPIIGYKTGTVITPSDPASERSFTDIDLDKWMRTTLTSIDALISPKYSTPADVLRQRLEAVTGAKQPDAMEQVLEAKKNLADGLKGAMIGVYAAGSAPAPTKEQLHDIQEAFKQALLSTAGQFYTVKAGIQFTADVNAAIAPLPGATEVPRIFGDIALRALKPESEKITGEEAPIPKKNISISSPKLDLKFAAQTKVEKDPSPYLSSLLSSTSTIAKSVTLNLDYDGQYIEHEIGTLPGIKDYQPSSWLSLVQLADLPNIEPFNAQLGQFEVPIVLRAFPDTPALVDQNFATDYESPCILRPEERQSQHFAQSSVLPYSEVCTPASDYNPLAKVKLWTYSFDYALQVHEQQDVVHGTITFNIADPDALFASDLVERDIFDNLAEFVHVYPKILTDLNTYLLPIDVDTSDVETLTNAQAALLSAANLIDWVADTARDTFTPATSEPIDAASAIAVPPVVFAISESSVTKGSVEALQITLALKAPLPDRVGAPLVEIQGYVCERTSGDNLDKATFLYKDPETGAYLSAAEGRVIPERRIVLPDLGILERQDAEAEVYIKRNEDLIDGKVIADPFVYQTPEVTFESPLHPTIQRGDSINIATIFSDPPGSSAKRSLECQLQLFYDALFANAATPDVTMQISLYYEYSINENVPLVRLPVYLLPPLDTALDNIPQGSESSPFERENGTVVTPLKEVIARQVEAWNKWYGENQPEPQEGRLLFEMTVMSNLTAQPMPTLKLTGLYLMLKDIV